MATLENDEGEEGRGWGMARLGIGENGKWQEQGIASLVNSDVGGQLGRGLCSASRQAARTAKVDARLG